MTAFAAPVALDLSSCAREPIHIPGSIQPHGLLLVLAADFTVRHVSANVEAMLGLGAAALYGTHVVEILGPTQTERFIASVAQGDFGAFNPTRFVLRASSGSELEFECTMHRVAETLVVEFEPFEMLEGTSKDPYALVRTPIARMEQAGDIETLARIAANEMLSISGFDRTMIYRFDEDWNGEVIAEAKDDAVEASYFGLHFPASDIPVQARRLYVRNALRLIPDVGYQPCELVPEFDPATGQSVDLSKSILRSVSPFHVAYLQNMGVRATLTISIVIGGRLWGLIACHHYRPRHLDYGMRAVCELLGHMLAWQIGARLETESLQEELRANGLLEAHGRSSAAFGDLATGLLAGAEGLLELFGAQGLAIRLDGEMWRIGATPADAALIAQIAASLRNDVADGVAVNHCVGATVPEAAGDADTASGALMLPLSEAGDEYVICFREEYIRNVYWGGDPNKPATALEGAIRPRESFASWRQTMRGHSERWTSHDRSAARNLRHRILERRQTIERGRAEERIRHLAHYDMLTQLPNRASFHDALSRSVDAAERDHSALAVLFVDIDRLKLFNDAFGHATGDLMLQVAATRMRECVRRDDVVARLGGDEFVIILPKIASEGDADRVAAKVLAAISEPFSGAGNSDLRFTASLGIALYPKDALEPETLLRHADLAMYRAKERGRNEFQRFGTGDALPNYERLTFERRLERGLGRNEIIPFYQPIVSAKNGELLGMEALARWQHPELGMLAPARFIALAEESRLIVLLGEAMLRAACTDCARWRQMPGRADLRVAVNVSARQFREDGFLQSIVDMLALTGLDPGGLELELTESMLIGNEAYAMKTLHALADAGIGVAIDDFGTGYSSLSYLRRLPVDTLKIDQSFVRELSALPDDSAIVRAIIAMAHSLKLAVVAEGVETLEQLEFLCAAGCDSLQGYYIAKPFAHPDATAFIDGFAANCSAG